MRIFNKNLLQIITKSALCFFIFCGIFTSYSYGAQTQTLRGGVATVDRVTTKFYGSWRVSAKLVSSNAYTTFKPQSVDIWNLSRVGNVINLSNPFTGASANITVSVADGNFIKFSKKGVYEHQILYDTVRIKIDENKFTGYNDVTLDSLSIYDKKVIKHETAKYEIKGERIAN